MKVMPVALWVFFPSILEDRDDTYFLKSSCNHHDLLKIIKRSFSVTSGLTHGHKSSMSMSFTFMNVKAVQVFPSLLLFPQLYNFPTSDVVPCFRYLGLLKTSFASKDDSKKRNSVP